MIRYGRILIIAHCDKLDHAPPSLTARSCHKKGLRHAMSSGTARKVDKTTTTLSQKDSEIRYRRLFETTQDGILILDAKTGMIEDVNPFLIKLLGYSRKEFVRKKLWEMGAFKDTEASKKAFEALQDDEYIRYEDLPLKAKGGQLVQVEFISNVYLVGDKKVIQCNIRDVTEHKRIVAALQENEKTYHDLINQSPDGFFVIEFSGKIIAVNQAMCRELQFSQKELLSMHVWEIIPENYLAQYRKRLNKILKGKSLKDAAEYEVRGKDGRTHYIEVFSAPHYSGEEMIGFQGIARDITARKRAAEDLRASERRFDLAAWATMDVVWERNLETRTISWNDNLQKLFHYPADQIEPTHDWWQDHIHPDSRIKVIDSLQAAIEQGEDFWSQEYRFRLADGSYADIFDRGYILYDEHGKPLQMIGAMVDMTEQKRAQEALRKSEEKFRTWIENSSDLVSVIGVDGIFQYVSPSYERLLGYKSEELVGTNGFDLIHPADRLRVIKIFFDNIQKTDGVGRAEFRFRHHDGSWRLFEGLGRTFLDENGEMAGLINSRDITERKQASDKLRESDNRFRALIENSSDAITLVDANGIAVYDSPAAPGMLGYGPEDWIGKDIFALIHPDDLPKTRDLFQNLRKTPGARVNSTFRVRHESGAWVWIEMVATNLLTEPGVNAIVMNYRDVSEQRRDEERIQRQLSHLSALSNIDSVIASNFDLKLSLSEILKYVNRELGVDATDILVLNSGSQKLEYVADHGFRTRAVREAQVRLGESYAGRAALERKLVQVPDLKHDPGNALLTTFFKGEDFVCYYGVPLTAKGKVKGVLEVFHRTPLAPDTEWLEFLQSLAGQAAIAIENATLFDGLQRSNLELNLAYDATIEGWSRALDLRDKETEGHTQRVTEITLKLARSFGLSEAELVPVRWGALLHDIGKMGVPDNILLKPGPLTDEEWVLMKTHPTLAYKLLSPIRYLQSAIDIPYCHHEKWDGSGYPRGLKGEQIPLVGRIFAVVDVWDAITSDRPYRAAWTREKALEHIRAASGTHYDPQVVDKFMQISNQI
jgi:PAS domain S-box-containing protein/putative nucleotidyltransferase with HDIG domain